jgi:hypothetical protein
MKALKNRIHYIIYGLLVIGIIWSISRNTKGRYELATAGTTGAVILDTKTSQLWIRSADVSVNLGTNQNPKSEEIVKD